MQHLAMRERRALIFFTPFACKQRSDMALEARKETDPECLTRKDCGVAIGVLLQREHYQRRIKRQRDKRRGCESDHRIGDSVERGYDANRAGRSTTYLSINITGNWHDTSREGPP